MLHAESHAKAHAEFRTEFEPGPQRRDVQVEVFVQSAAHGAYKRVQAETSSSEDLITLLYDALLKNLQRAETGFHEEDAERVNAALVRSQEILLELLSSVNPEAGELSDLFTGLYGYMYQRLVAANVDKEIAPAQEVRHLIEPIREAWLQAAASAPTRPSVGRPHVVQG